MHFKYKAMNEAGHMVSGELQADNAEDLDIRLQRLQLDLISFRTQRSSRRRAFKFNFGKNYVTREELITFCIYMDQLLSAGVPLLQGLQDMRDSVEPSRFKDVVASLIEDVQAGQQLSYGMQRFPEVFDTIFVSLVHVGEESGELSEVFKHLTESLKWQDEIIAQTKKLLMYPSFAAATIFGMLFFMMMFLVPQAKIFMLNMIGELPLETQILINISDFVVAYWMPLLIMPFVLIIGLWAAMKLSYRVHFQVDRLKLKVWIVGPIMQKIILARFASFFALMYSAGITVMDSLVILQKTANNLAIEKALEEVSDLIADGSSITHSFAEVKLFPPLVLRMLSIGENTGALDHSLNNVSYFYDREVKESIGQLQAMIEPIMIIILGIIMAAMIVSILGPIYDVAIQNADMTSAPPKGS